MIIEEKTVIVTSSTRHLTFLLEKLYTSSQVKVTTDDAVWWRYLKAFVSYRVPNGQTDERAITYVIAWRAKIAAKWYCTDIYTVIWEIEREKVDIYAQYYP